MGKLFGKLDRGQGGAAEEGFASDGCYAVGNGDIRKRSAILEHAVGNCRELFGERDIHQLLAEAERAVTDRGNGVRNGDLLDRRTKRKCASADGFYRIFNDDFLKIFTFFADEFGDGFSAENDSLDGLRVEKIIGG